MDYIVAMQLSFGPNPAPQKICYQGWTTPSAPPPQLCHCLGPISQNPYLTENSFQIFYSLLQTEGSTECLTRQQHFRTSAWERISTPFFTSIMGVFLLFVFLFLFLFFFLFVSSKIKKKNPTSVSFTLKAIADPPSTLSILLDINESFTLVLLQSCGGRYTLS